MEKICQSCGMPMEKIEDHGTNNDGNKNPDYCHYCYQNGKFTDDVSLEKFIEHQVEIAKTQLKMPEEKAKKMAMKLIPKLKRWNKFNFLNN